MGNEIWIGLREQMLLQDYHEAKEHLAENKSEKNYRDMIKACHWIAWAWELVKSIDEFQGVIRDYEEVVLEYWKRFQTAESLSQVVYFYNDGWVRQCLDADEEKAVHMKKGIFFAELYHKMEDSDYSACICVDAYIELCKICRPGKEGLGYAEKACNLAKEYTMKYVTLQMIDKYHEAVWIAAAYDRFCCEEEEAERKEQEYQEIVERLEQLPVLEAQMHQKKGFNRDGFYLNLMKTGERVKKTVDVVIENQQNKLECIYGIIAYVLDTVYEEGMSALKRCVGNIRDEKEYLADFLADYIQLLMDGVDKEIILGMMANEFIVREPDDFGNLVLFLYMLTVIVIHEKSRYREILHRDEAGKNLNYIKNEYMAVLQRLAMMDKDDFAVIAEYGNDMQAINRYQIELVRQAPEEPEEMACLLIQETGERVNKQLVQRMAEYIAVSRQGLRESDLQALLEQEGIRWSSLDFSRTVHYMPMLFTERDNGRVDFTHRIIRLGLRSGINEEVMNRNIFAYLKTLPREDELRNNEMVHYCYVLDEKKYLVEYLEHEDGKALEKAALELYWICMEDSGEWYAAVLQGNEELEVGRNMIVFAWNYFAKVFTRGSMLELGIQLKIYDCILQISRELYEEEGTPESEQDYKISCDCVERICNAIRQKLHKEQ